MDSRSPIGVGDKLSGNDEMRGGGCPGQPRGDCPYDYFPGKHPHIRGDAPSAYPVFRWIHSCGCRTAESLRISDYLRADSLAIQIALVNIPIVVEGLPRGFPSVTRRFIKTSPRFSADLTRVTKSLQSGIFLF